MAAIIWTNAVLLSSGPLGTNLSQIVFEIRTFSRKWFWNVIWINGGYIFVSASIYYGHLPVIKGLDMSQALYVTGHLLISICNDNLEIKEITTKICQNFTKRARQQRKYLQYNKYWTGEHNKNDVKHWNTLGCLHQHSCRGLSLWNSQDREAV